jgi:hypothetical protein
MAEEREMLYVMPAKLANPAPLGLGGFALTTFVLNVHNAGLVDIGAALPLGLFYGGLAQLVAGFLEFRTGNTFGMTAFGSYGAFWIALSSMVLMEMNGWISADASKGWLLVTLVAWTIFTFVLWIATFRHSQALVWVFTTLLILFGLLDSPRGDGKPSHRPHRGLGRDFLRAYGLVSDGRDYSERHLRKNRAAHRITREAEDSRA